MDEAAAQGASKTKVFLTGIDETFKSIGSGLILGAITKGFEFVVKSVIQFNQKTFDIAKNVGTTVKEAEQLQAQFQNIAISSSNVALISKDVAKTYADISNTFGFLVPSNKEFLETATS